MFNVLELQVFHSKVIRYEQRVTRSWKAENKWLFLVLQFDTSSFMESGYKYDA